MTQRGKHPSEPVLALLAGGELGFWERWQINLHVRLCPNCQGEVEAFTRAAKAFNSGAREIPSDLAAVSGEWETLSREMTGNIRVGLAAGECIEIRKPLAGRFGWRGAVVVGALSVLVVTGWFLNIPRQQTEHLLQSLRQIASGTRSAPDEAATLETSAAGIGLRQNGRGMTLLNPKSAAVTLSVSTRGSVGASYIDAETDQVTINNVYSQ